MKSVYSLHCTVCSKNFDGRSSWLKHLYQLDHQNKARENCEKSWFGEKCKDKLKEDETDSLVVIFSSFSLNELTMLGSLLERLTEIGGSGFTWITDFVWWPERDRVGYLQFESRKLVNELFGVLDGLNLQVENTLVQLKRAVDIPSLEFSALLPREIANLIFLERDNIPTSHSATTELPSSLIPASSYIPNAKTSLQRQFNQVCKLTEIPDGEFNEALKITQTLKDLLTEKHADTEVIMFRNFYLRLKNNESSTLFLYTYIPVDHECHPSGYIVVDHTVQNFIFQSSKFKKSFPSFTRVPPESNLDGGTCFEHKTTKFRFNYIGHPLLIVEAHLNLLIQYLCSFNPNVKPVLTLVHFWARSNYIKLAAKPVIFSKQNIHCPEPSALEWMVILFLSREGLLPRVREILEKPHVKRSVGEGQTDFAFSMDPEYPKEWRRSHGIGEDVTSDQFILEVVNLARTFFEFYGNKLEEGCWVLNPKDGEILKREGTRISKSGLSEDEKRHLTGAQSSKSARTHKLEISYSRIYLLNPLHITWRLSFCVKTWTEITCGKMKETGKRLGEYLSLMKNGKGDERGGLTLESVLKVK